MNTEKAIKLLREMQEAWKLQITGDAFDAIEMAITALQELENARKTHENARNAQEHTNNSTDGVKNANLTQSNGIESKVKGMTVCRVPEDDYISRQEAIDVCNYAIDLWHGQLGEGIVIAVRKKIAELPSVQPEQPEIIRCRDCVKCQYDEVFDQHWCNGREVRGDFYCADAERRTDEQT